jgi:hypothetical protein
VTFRSALASVRAFRQLAGSPGPCYRPLQVIIGPRRGEREASANLLAAVQHAPSDYPHQTLDVVVVPAPPNILPGLAEIDAWEDLARSADRSRT